MDEVFAKRADHKATYALEKCQQTKTPKEHIGACCQTFDQPQMGSCHDSGKTQPNRAQIRKKMHQQVGKGVSRSRKLRVTNNRSASAAGNAFLQTQHMVTRERHIGYIGICRISGLELFWKGLPGFRIDFCNS